MPVSFASRTSRCAPSRTCATEPAAPGESGSWTVWIESIASTSGCSSSTCAQTAGSDVSATMNTPGCSVPSRPARSRTCAGDSSPQTSRQRAPLAAIAPSAWSSSVLLPMPGSPPMRVTEPVTRPPSSTRSSSDNPVGRRGAPSGSISEMGTGRLREAPDPPPVVVPVAVTGASPKLPHSPQSVQRPSHWVASYPHSLHR